MPLQTRRLLLRPMGPGDGPAIYAARRDAHDELLKWMPWAQSVPTEAACERHARALHADWVARKQMVCAVVDRATDQLIGGTGMHPANWRVPSIEIGYWLRTSRVGEGLITEAVSAVCQYAVAVIGARRLEIRCDAENARSAAVARRLGFALEGRLANEDTLADGTGLRDTLIFGRIDGVGLPDVDASW